MLVHNLARVFVIPQRDESRVSQMIDLRFILHLLSGLDDLAAEYL
jgi:hypothetical protein